VTRSSRRLRQLAGGPLGAAVAVAAAWTVVATVDPRRPGFYPVCPLLRLTGWSCPLCGGLRAAHALAHGDLIGALDRNAFFVAVLPLVAAGWVRWVALRTRGSPASPFPRSPRWSAAALVVLVLFGVLRNTPWGSALAP
jgi:Protein of unknown function (DUF2752)